MRVQLTVDDGTSVQTYTVEQPSTLAMPLIASVLASAIANREREIDYIRTSIKTLADAVAACASPGQVTVTDQPADDKTVRCPSCGEQVKPGRFDSYGRHPRAGEAALCPGAGP